MFKLMAIDLDGTLLNSFGEVSENTRKALQAAKERGVEVVLASGRPISSTESLAVELGVDNYLISGNGAAVYDIKEQKVVYDRFLTKEQVMKIAKLCDIAMCGDNGIGECYGAKLDLPKCIAKGDDTCQLRYHKVKK